MSQALRRCSPRLIQAMSTRRTVAPTRIAPLWNHRPLAPSQAVLSPVVSLFHQGGRLFQVSTEHAQKVDAAPDMGGNTQGPIADFRDLDKQGLIHPNVVDTITRYMGLTSMTEVQSRTLNEALSGVDLVAQAKTGTGKTLAFLLPLVQNVIKDNPALAVRNLRHRASPSDIRAIIISPTRELAEQIAEEARRLTSRTNVIVQTAVGGSQKRAGLRMIQQQGCHILVATPGRLNDVLSDEFSRVEAPNLTTLVLDEADRLLDAGFEAELRSIMEQLPDPNLKDRQTLMFSATIPREVVGLVRRTLKPGFCYVKCVNEQEAPTHDKVRQRVVQVAGLENMLPALYELCEREILAAKQPGGQPFKAIVFFNSTAEVTLAASTFRNIHQSARRHPLHPARVYEIHGKLTQQQRTMASERFRNSESAILLSSDVTARGLDFPNVTHVIQIGLPRQREDYVHRIGRTARAGKEGEGWLFVGPLETHELRSKLADLPLENDTSLETAAVDMSQEAKIPEKAADILSNMVHAQRRVDQAEKKRAYQAFFGYYSWYPMKQTLVNALNNLAKFGWGMQEPPVVPSGLIQKLGLSKVRGLNVERAMEPSRFGAPRDFGRRTPPREWDAFDKAGISPGPNGRDRRERRLRY